MAVRGADERRRGTREEEDATHSLREAQILGHRVQEDHRHGHRQIIRDGVDPLVDLVRLGLALFAACVVGEQRLENEVAALAKAAQCRLRRCVNIVPSRRLWAARAFFPLGELAS